VDALASTGDEGRDTCDKLRGAGKRFDPKNSEWGNPVGVIPHHPYLNT
tara:strand:+ start:394 stop:537 length:144 start_codon:yes stop_codon:yes gene_type:complete